MLPALGAETASEARPTTSRNAIDSADDRLFERIEHAKAPFWAHVREALDALGH
jgi:hypothetical protein